MFLSTALAAWLACGTASAAPAPVVNFGVATPSRNGAVTVRPGDSIERIARLYHLQVEEIAAMNHLHKPYHLTVGKRLVLPMPREYVVARTDTLYGIARMYGVSAEAIAGANHLHAPYHLRHGQVLHIPNANAHAHVEAAHQQVSAEVAKPQPEVIAAHDTPSPVAEEAASSQSADHVRLLKKPGPSLFSAMVSRIAKEDARPKADPFAPSPLIHSQAPAAPLAPIVAVSHRPGFIWPVKGEVISSYGPKDGGMYNDGINIAAPRGTPVLAAADGTVAYVGHTLQSYGNLVLIRHGGGMITAYAHMNSVSVRQGMHVVRGQPIGSVGSTGTVAHSQLHFEVRRGKETIDPRQYLG